MKEKERIPGKGKFKTKLQKLLSQPLEKVTSITDIEDKYFGMEQLTTDELKALKNFERYRMRKLKESKNKHKFNRAFMRIRVLSNLAPYTEFLKPHYQH